MRKRLLFSMALMASLAANAQTWTKLSTNFDSLWTSSVKYFNKGDTLIYYGSTTGTGSFNAKRFYVSTDGGQTFNRDFTTLDAIGYTPIFGLPLNDMIIGFKNTPNSGSFIFQGLNNWASLLPLGVGIYGEVNAGTLLFNAGSGSTSLSTMTGSGANFTTVASGSSGIDLICTHNKGNRLFLGGGTNNLIKYVDNGNFNAIQTSTIPSQGNNSDVVRFFEAGANLFAVVDAGTNKLFKSTDNGVSWSLINTTYDNGGNTTSLTSSYIIGTPNGNIFFLESSSGSSENVFLSTDGGATAVKIPNGLPTNGLHIGPTIGKILTKGNKVWYQVCAASTVDFVSTDTSIAGLYIFNGGTSGKEIQGPEKDMFSVYPNPSNNTISINSNSSILSYQISNTLGQIVKSGLYNHQPINLSALEKGIYFLTITTNNHQVSTKKILKE